MDEGYLGYFRCSCAPTGAVPFVSYPFCLVFSFLLHESNGIATGNCHSWARLAGQRKKHRHGREDRLPVRRWARVAHVPGQLGLQERENWHLVWFCSSPPSAPPAAAQTLFVSPASTSRAWVRLSSPLVSKYDTIPPLPKSTTYVLHFVAFLPPGASLCLSTCARTFARRQEATLPRTCMIPNHVSAVNPGRTLSSFFVLVAPPSMSIAPSRCLSPSLLPDVVSEVRRPPVGGAKKAHDRGHAPDRPAVRRRLPEPGVSRSGGQGVRPARFYFFFLFCGRR